jgi:hypothetical protein
VVEFLSLPQYKMIIDDINKIKDVFDIENITNMSIGLKLICLGEYGDLFINPEHKKIFICLGDCNPFGEIEKLEDYIRYNCIKTQEKQKEYEIIIEYECIPNSDESWYKFDINSNITKHQ